MKTGIGVGLLGALFLFSCAVFSAMHRAYGATPVALVASTCLGMAAWVATPEARQLATWVSGALHDTRMSLKVAALTIEMDEGQASRQLACNERLNFAQWAKLGPKFLDAFALQILRTHGNYTSMENGLLARALNKLEEFIISDQSSARRIA